LIERVKADLFNHIRHAPQSDDITMIAVHRKG
jgi:serine phosphatase RsbU (regulator of sigma subunit)